MVTNEHKKRMKAELLAAGATRYGLVKNETRRLPELIHEDEHIGAAVNGRSESGAVMLVATDKRLLYLDFKSFYSSVDEITYDVVSGVMHHTQGLFSNIIVHTRVGDYNLRFVNNKQGQKFVKYLESKRLEKSQYETPTSKTDELKLSNLTNRVELDKQARNFLQTNSVGVLSTIDRMGNVCGATIYYVCDPENNLYILTKSETTKARNILQHPQVALTVFEEYSLQTIQISGLAEVVTDQVTSRQVLNLITQERQHSDGPSLPPVTKLQDGAFVVFKIIITEANYRNFSK